MQNSLEKVTMINDSKQIKSHDLVITIINLLKKENINRNEFKLIQSPKFFTQFIEKEKEKLIILD